MLCCGFAIAGRLFRLLSPGPPPSPRAPSPPSLPGLLLSAGLFAGRISVTPGCSRLNARTLDDASGGMSTACSEASSSLTELDMLTQPWCSPCFQGGSSQWPGVWGVLVGRSGASTCGKEGSQTAMDPRKYTQCCYKKQAHQRGRSATSTVSVLPTVLRSPHPSAACGLASKELSP